MVSAKRVILTSFFVDLLDVISSLLVTILSGSVVMLAQVLEGIADLLASGFLLIGLKRSGKISDKNHPFGYGRELYFWTLISSIVMLSLTATLSLYFGWQRFLNPESLNNLHLAYLVLGITVITNGYAFSLSFRRLGGKSNKIWSNFFNSPLIETKATFVLDLMGTAASFLGLLALVIYKISGDQRLDGLGAMIIGAVLAIFAILLIASVKDLLVGKSISEEVKLKITQAALSVRGVKRVTELKATYIGSEQMLINIDLDLEDRLETSQIEKIIGQAKELIKRNVREASIIQIELKPHG